MEYKRITENDLVGKGVVGQPDTPALSALEMQNKVEEIVRDVVIPSYNNLVEALTENGKPVQSSDVMLVRIGESGDLQVSVDGVQWQNVADKALEGKADKSSSYTKDQLYTKEETDTKLDTKAEADNVYTKTETDAAIGSKITQLGAGDMAKAVYDTDGDGVVDNAAKLAGHGADYFSSWRDCSNVPFNEIVAGKGAFIVNWNSANAADGNVMLGISDGWTAIAVSYTGNIYVTTIEKNAWEHVSAPASFMPKVQYVTQAGTDLNDYKQDGFYYFDADYTPANIPAGVNGWLEVYSSNVGAVKQKWFRHGTADSNDHNTYIRTFTSGSWSGWAFVMTAKGGTFAGDVKAYETARTTRGLFNNETRAGSTTGTLQSVKYFIDVT